MSLDPRAATVRSTAPTKFEFKLAANTETANALAQKLFRGKISQKDYDAQIYSTSILSTDRVKSVPIILTLDDTLATLMDHANREFKIPPAKVQTTKMYVLWSKKVFHASGVYPVPENLVLLDQDTLKMTLTFMKASPQVEQLLVEFEGDVTALAPGSKVAARQVNPVNEDDHMATLTERLWVSMTVPDRSNLIEKRKPATRKGKEQERSSEVDRKQRDSLKVYHQNLGRFTEERILEINRAKELATQQDGPAKKKRRKTEGISTSGRKPEKGHSKEEKRGSHRSGKDA